jgi:predicted RNA-binding Zn ribbon-like protein
MPVIHLDILRWVFDLDGGRPCLDFANTFSDEKERLPTYADLVDFAAQSTLLTPEDAAWLHAQAQRDPRAVKGVMTRARALRQAIRGIFFAVAAETTPPEAALGFLNLDLAVSLQHARVLPNTSGNGYVWGWSGRDLDAPLWPIARSAADLLTSDDDLRLVRQCGAEDCQWLFLDSTRNRSRQWCSMQACGNREKARRHYRRLRQRRDVVPASASNAVTAPKTVPGGGARHAPRRGRQSAAAPAADASATAE